MGTRPIPITSTGSIHRQCS